MDGTHLELFSDGRPVFVSESKSRAPAVSHQHQAPRLGFPRGTGPSHMPSGSSRYDPIDLMDSKESPPNADMDTSAPDQGVVWERLQFVVQRNEARASAVQDFIKVMCTMLHNMQAHPESEPYRTLHTLRENFQRKIAILDGAFELLEAMGFRRESAGGTPAYVMPEHLIHDGTVAQHLALLSTLAPRQIASGDAARSAPAPSAMASAARPPSVSQEVLNAVPILVDMGFSADMALQALTATNGDVAQAVQRLAPPVAPMVRADSIEAVKRLAAELERAEEKKRRADEAASAALAYRWAEQAAREEEEKKDRLAAISLQDDLQARYMMQAEAMSGARLPLEMRNIGLLGDAYAAGMKYDCPVCFDGKSINALMVLSCKHWACIDCMRRYVETAINGNAALD